MLQKQKQYLILIYLSFLPLQVNSLSIDSLQVSASTSGSLEKQQNLPLKITLSSFTDAACGQHDFT